MPEPTPRPRWEPPEGTRVVETLDMHTAGEPLRIILSGFPVPEGATILERRRTVRTRYDTLRKMLMWEPRGHREMYGCLLVPPERKASAFGVLFLHNEGYSTMCGHAVIALGRFAVEAGLVAAREPVTQFQIDTPAGAVSVTALVEGGRVWAVSFVNVPSFVEATELEVDVPGYGAIRYDLAFGGAYYAFVDVSAVGLTGRAEEHQNLIEAGRAIKHAVMARHTPRHPGNSDLNFLYGTIFTASSPDPGVHSRHVCIFADGQVDRSPTGTGVSARLALLHHRGLIVADEMVVIESIVGTRFKGRVVGETTEGPYPAVLPEVTGTASFTGRHTFYLEPDDALPEGFFLG